MRKKKKRKNNDRLKLKKCFIFMVISLIGFFIVSDNGFIYSEDTFTLSTYNRLTSSGEEFFKSISEIISMNKENSDAEEELIYYNQEDEKWADIAFGTSEDTIGTSGCGVTAMAMVLANLKDSSINPVELANYALDNGYCYGYTTRGFFSEIIQESKYSLTMERLESTETSRLEELLSDGKHMAIAIMNIGHFTKVGHYVVVYGSEEINGQIYFDVLDPNMNNDNYGDDGSIIYDANNLNGNVKASINIFQNECSEYWVYSVE